MGEEEYSFDDADDPVLRMTQQATRAIKRGDNEKAQDLMTRKRALIEEQMASGTVDRERAARWAAASQELMAAQKEAMENSQAQLRESQRSSAAALRDLEDVHGQASMR